MFTKLQILDDLPSFFSFINFQTILSISPSVTGVLLVILLALFFLSFMMAGGESAFFSLTLKEINILKRKRQPAFRRILHLLEQPKILQTSLFISNTFSNIGFIITSNILINSWMETMAWESGSFIFILKLIGVTLFLVLFAEVLPRVWATHHNIWFALVSSLLVEIVHSLLYRISKRIVRMTERLERNISPQQMMDDDTASIDDAIDLLPEHEATSAEKQLLKGIRKFAKTEVKQVMRTRLDVNGLEVSLPFGEVIRLTQELHYSRLPVYRNNLDEIVGILHTKDLLPHSFEQDGFDWHTLIRPPFFVHEHKLIEDLLQEFRQKRIHFAIVADEFGGTSGIVTLEDIVEEVTGEIKDEFDDEETVNKQIDEHTYVLEGKTMINDVCKILRLPSHTFDAIRGDSDSLAGLVLEIAGAFPNTGDTLHFKQFHFTPIAINRNRIEKVQITVDKNENPTHS